MILILSIPIIYWSTGPLLITVEAVTDFAGLAELYSVVGTNFVVVFSHFFSFFAHSVPLIY